MLKLTLEIFPMGVESMAEVLAEIEICNTLKNPGRPKIADYLCEVTVGGTVRKIRIKGHERSKGYWPLLRRLARHLEKPHKFQCKE